MKTLIIFIFITLLLTIPLFADNCPKCGKSYGRPAPGDEARVYSLRRQHEAQCGGGGGGGYSSGGGMEMTVMNAFTNAIISAIPTPEQIEAQRIRESILINNRGVEYENAYNIDGALDCYERAVQMNPHDHILQENLRKMRGKKEAQIADEYVQDRDWDNAVKHYKAALAYDDNDSYRLDIKLVDEYRKRDEPIRQKMSELEKSKIKITGMLDDLYNELGTGPGVVDLREEGSPLDFVGEKEPLYTRGSKGSAPVDLSKSEKVDLPAVDPAGISGKFAAQKILDSKKDFISIAYPEDKADPVAAGARTGLILDALEKGKGDWKESVLYLEKDAYKTGEPSSAHKQAVSYLEGMQCYEEMAMSKAKEEAYKNAGFSADEEDSFSLFDEPGSWPGPKREVPSMMGGSAGAENPYNWKLNRMKDVVKTLEKHNDNLTAGIDDLEQRAIADSGNGSVRNALHFLRGYEGYQTYAVDRLKKK